MLLTCGHHRLDLSAPVVMGVLNVTPDSFSDGGRFSDLAAALGQARKMAGEGAAIIDVGGESTRPGAAPVGVEEELARVVPVIEALCAELDLPVSVDTSKPEVMRAALAAGATMVNDVAALRAPGALDAVAGCGAAVCLMHMQGEPQTMQAAPRYDDVVAEVRGFLERRVAAAEAAGIARNRLVVDPGFGFGKTLEHNLLLLGGLGRVAPAGLPLLAGLSRKSMIGQLTGRPLDGRLAGQRGAGGAGGRARRRDRAGARRGRDARCGEGRCRAAAVPGKTQGREAMSRQYFGTDGVRGRVGGEPMTVEFALRLASAAARVLAPNGGSVLVGKDTRLSGYMFEAALEAGFVAAGVDVLLAGPLPTPGIAYMLTHLKCDFGAVISASHNSYEDNGIKFFDRNGAKLPDELERQIEAYLDEPALTLESQRLGRATRVDKQRVQYQKFCMGTMPAGTDLRGFKIVVDCANGAAYKVAPRVLTDLGAEIIPIGCSPNGRNINDGCGSTRPELLRLTVPGVRADAGIGLDGDGDRLIMVDHLGRIVDGDQLMYVLAGAWHEAGQLPGPVVGTFMSNLGLELALAERGIPFLRAQVGDRYVLQMMRDEGSVLGGETSGHLLCLRQTTTGDGLVAALQVLAIMKRTGKSLAELAAGMSKFPQRLANVSVPARFDPEADQGVRAAVAAARSALGKRGRVVLRASGTEPVFRVMVEGEDEGAVQSHVAAIVAAIRAAGA